MNAEFIIETDESGKSKVPINGVEMSHCIRKIEYIHEGGELPIVHIDFIPDTVTIDSPRETNVKFPDEFIEMVKKKYGAVQNTTP